jgi:hypothetical protein
MRAVLLFGVLSFLALQAFAQIDFSTLDPYRCRGCQRPFSRGDWSPVDERREERARHRAEYERNRETGNAAIARGDYRGALRLARANQSLFDGPQLRAWIAHLEAMIIWHDGWTLLEQGNRAGALAAFRRVRALSPDTLSDEGRRFLDQLSSQVEDDRTLARIDTQLGTERPRFERADLGDHAGHTKHSGSAADSS